MLSGIKEVLNDANEAEKWTTDEDGEDKKKDDEDVEQEGSLSVRNLALINKKAQRLNQDKLEDLFFGGNIGLIHDYSGGQATAFNSLFADSGNENEDFDGSNKIMNNDQRNANKAVNVRPPKPRSVHKRTTTLRIIKSEIYKIFNYFPKHLAFEANYIFSTMK